MRTFIKHLTVAVAVVAAASVYGVPTLTIDDGINPAIVVADGGGSDSNPLAGAVTWIGNVGVWTLNVDTGVTKPQVGSATNPRMDLHFLGGSSAAGNITISFSDDGFTYAGGLNDDFGGTTDGAVTDLVNINAGTVLTLGPTSASPFALSGSTGVVLNPADVLTIVVQVSHNGSGLTSGDKYVTAPDGGSTIILLGSALSALGLFLRRKKA